MFPLYLDEDTSSTGLVDALRSRHVDVVRVFNAKHFSALHHSFLAAGRTHAGIIVGSQQRYSVGEQLRRLLRILASRSSEQMRDQITFLSNW